MTLIRKHVFTASSLALASLGVLAAGAVNTAEALTLPTGTTLTVTVPTVLPPTVTVPPVTTALPPSPPVVTTVLPPVTTVVPPVPPPPTATIVVPPPPPPVTTVTTRVPTAPSVPAVTAVPSRPPAAAPAPVAIATVPARTAGDSTAPAAAATPGASSAETAPDGAGTSVVVGSSGSSGGPIVTDGLSASGAHAEAARRSSVGRLRADRPGLVRGKQGALGAITFAFRVPRRGTVVVTVTQVAPSCRVVGTFEVRGRRGVNRVRWSGRVDGRLLPPGTYRLAPRLLRSGQPVAEPLPAAVRGVPVVILPRQTSPRLLEDRSALARLRSRNVCRWETGGDESGQLLGSPFALDLASFARPAAAAVDGGEGGTELDAPRGDGSSAESGGVLGVVATPFGDGSGGSRFAGAALLLLLVPALVLLTLAAVPRRALSRVPAAALARHQDDFVLLGLGWVLVWALYIGIVYALSLALD